MTRGLKFRIKEVEGLCFPCSENKGADQLRGYHEADLRLCFRICKKPVFSRRGSYAVDINKNGLSEAILKDKGDSYGYPQHNSFGNSNRCQHDFMEIWQIIT